MSETEQDQTGAEQIVVQWVESNLGPITSIERQGRWRPAWYIDTVADGVEIKLYVRGDRGKGVDTQPQPLSFEYKVLQLFADSGLRVPHLYGFIEEIPAIVMERLPGRPDLRTAANDADRDAVTSQFIDQMVLMHRVDPDRMEAAGAPRPADGAALALAHYRRMEPLYLATKNRAEPAIEFVRQWLERNLPTPTDIAYPIAVDAGQFIFEGDQLTAMLDFEYSTLGDYHADLAALRLRNRMESVGDLEFIYKEYEKRSGLAVDPARLRYHTVIKGILPPLHNAGIMGAPTSAVDYVQYSVYNAVWLRIALDSIAEMNGWPVEEFTPPAEQQGTRFGIVIDAMTLDLETTQASDELANYQRERNLRTLRYLRRCDVYQGQLEDAYLAEVGEVTGTLPKDWSAADTALEHYVLNAGPAEDERLLRLLWRQVLGQCFLLTEVDDAANYHMLTTPLARLSFD